MKDIKNPIKETWFICLENKVVKAYGNVATNQTMTTRWSVVKSYTTESEWLRDLASRGIDVDNELNNTQI
tara:strand:- start:297 stop:506 length:210 start_codon:yes stop_codon:yes gene_type:complete